MAQHPKFVVASDSNGTITWRLERGPGDILGVSDLTFASKSEAEQNICEHIETAVAASGVSISLGTEFTPVIEREGFAEDEPPEAPAPGAPFDDQTVETELTQDESEEESQEEG